MISPFRFTYSLSEKKKKIFKRTVVRMKLYTLITKYRTIHYNQKCYLKQVLSNFGSNDYIDELDRLIKTRYKQKVVTKIPNRNMDTSLQIIANGGCMDSKSIVITFKGIKILFNCGENTLRIANEYRQKVSKMSHIFLTSLSWSHIGGLMGITQTLKAVGATSVVLYGPKGIEHFYHGTKNFVYLNKLNIKIRSPDDCESFNHKMGATISCIPLKRLSQSDRQNNQNDCEYETKENLKRMVVDETGEVKKMRTEEREVIDTMCYMFQAKDIPGKLCLEKAISMGVEIGPKLRILKSGNDVTLSDGTVIKHKDVCNPSIKGTIILVVDCPTEDDLESLVSHSFFKKYQVPAEDLNKSIVACIAHFTPREVISHPRYKDWMHKFGVETHHIILNENNAWGGNLDVYKKQYQLHLIHPEIFPLLDEKLFIEEKEECIDDRLSVCHPNTMYSVYWKPERTVKPYLPLEGFINTYKEEISDIPGFQDVLAEVRKKIEDKTKSLTNCKKYPQTVMLGTGSATPSKTRNVSSILVRINEKHSIMLDCGEGTYSQMLRLYGKSKIKDILSTIQAVYVSHLHTDHHMGLFGILRERRKVTTDPLFLIIPTVMRKWLILYNSKFESILDKSIIISNESLLLNNTVLQTDIENQLYQALNIQELRTTLVHHHLHSFGVSFITNAGEKIVYSGDTMPCESLIELGKNCDLLIHEATMYDDLMEDAIKKRHSTVSQAIDVGKRMEANFTLLTHFSQRYPKLQVLPNENDATHEKVGIAFDNMKISFGQLPILPLLYPCLTLLYKNYISLE